MYSQQASHIPTRLQSKNSYSLKNRSKKGTSPKFLKKPLSMILACTFVVLSISSSLFIANKLDKVTEVGFEPEYQTGGNAYYSDNALFYQYDGDIEVTLIYHGDTTIGVKSSEITVGELISKLSLSLGEEDVVDTDLDAKISDGMQIKIDLVTTEEKTETVAIPFEKEEIETSTLAKGVTQVTQKGVDGEKVQTVIETYVNGELTESEVMSEEITKKPVKQITSIGTRLAPDTTAATTTTTYDENGSTTTTVYDIAGTYTATNGTKYNYTSYIDVEATAYGYEAGNITATGKAVSREYMAVDPKVIPYHTKCFVTGVPLGTYGDMWVMTAEDCGGFRGKRIDIFLGDETSCRNFGRRNMRVFILA